MTPMTLPGGVSQAATDHDTSQQIEPAIFHSDVSQASTTDQPMAPILHPDNVDQTAIA